MTRDNAQKLICEGSKIVESDFTWYSYVFIPLGPLPLLMKVVPV